MKFMHIADVHLGYQQYGVGERFNDFSRAYLSLADQAVAEGIDFLLLAGDLFHNRSMEPLSLQVAIRGLEKLKQAGIPVLAVEGNHEKAFYRDQQSWMEFLDSMGYLKLLSPRFEEGEAIIEPYGDQRGAYVDLDQGVRVYGMKYFGASTSTAVKSFAENLENIDHSHVSYSILMMHAGLEGQLAYTGRLKHNDVALLREKVDYVALGHIHKPYEVDHWIYNPGSPETCSMEEVSWPERGYYLVEITPEAEYTHQATLMAAPRRKFYRFRLGVDGFKTPNEVYDAVRALIEDQQEHLADSKKPVVELRLGGILPFSRYDLDLEYIKGLLEEAWDPLIAKVKSNITPAEFEITADRESSRSELERNVLQELFERDSRYREQSEGWARGAVDLKRLIQEGTSPELIVEHVAQLQKELMKGEN
jgi:DNA repair exonuclease SbcCD nuclease subunit